MVDDDQFLRWSMTTSPLPGIRGVSDGIAKHTPQMGGPPSGKEAEMQTKLLAAIGSGAVIASALIVGATNDPGQQVAGSGNGIVNTFSQPTQGAMTLGATATAGPPPTTVATSMASPTAKATVLGSECNTSG